MIDCGLGHCWEIDSDGNEFCTDCGLRVEDMEEQ
jgi:hypothetical protein